MSEEQRHRYYRTPISEWMERAANEMATDAVGVWDIVPNGRQGFGLEGEPLVDYVRRQIAVLLARGGVPVLGGGLGGEHHWVVQRQYGTRPGEILDNIMREWLERGAADEDPEWLWFTLPENAWTPRA
jgi:hypothetical protein